MEGAGAEICRVVAPGGKILIIDKNAEHWGKLETPEWEKWFHRKELEKLLRRHCRGEVSSRFISYWEDVEPDGLFLARQAVKQARFKHQHGTASDGFSLLHCFLREVSPLRH